MEAFTYRIHRKLICYASSSPRSKQGCVTGHDSRDDKESFTLSRPTLNLWLSIPCRRIGQHCNETTET